MTSRNPSTKLDRRRVFAGAGVAGAAAAAAALLPRVAAPPAVADAVAKATEPAGGYQLSEHVLSYYRTTRI